MREMWPPEGQGHMPMPTLNSAYAYAYVIVCMVRVRVRVRHMVDLGHLAATYGAEKSGWNGGLGLGFDSSHG